MLYFLLYPLVHLCCKNAISPFIVWCGWDSVGFQCGGSGLGGGVPHNQATTLILTNSTDCKAPFTSNVNALLGIKSTQPQHWQLGFVSRMFGRDRISRNCVLVYDFSFPKSLVHSPLLFVIFVIRPHLKVANFLRSLCRRLSSTSIILSDVSKTYQQWHLLHNINIDVVTFWRWFLLLVSPANQSNLCIPSIIQD